MDANGIESKQTIPASQKLGKAKAAELAKAASRVIVAKGKKVVTFSKRKATPDDQTLAAHMLGPTGNLRAPTVRKGKTLIIGFNEEVFIQALRV